MIFVDTSAFYALEVEDDVNHERALEFAEELRKGRYGALVTTDYVLDETLTLLRSRHGLEAATLFYSKVARSKSLKIVWVDEELFRKAVEIFAKSKGRAWSFTDCVSFATMKLLGISYAFAFDEHFAQAGFVALPSRRKK